MDTVKFNSFNTKVIAHRGLSGIEAENTLSAFVAAANRNYFGIETDIHVTSDKRFAVIHDDNTKRVADKNINVEKSTYNKLKKLKLKSLYGTEYRSDLKIPLAEEYIDICKRYGKTAVIELKNLMDFYDIAKLVRMIEKRNYLSDSIFISFHADNLVNVRMLSEKQSVQYLTNKFTSTVFEKIIKHGFDADIWYKVLTKEIINQLHGENIKVNCWTCDHKADAERLASWGVDYITTNYLEGI